MTECRFWDYRCCCFGSDAGGTQRYRCLRCLKTFPSRATASRRCTCCSRQPAGGPACWWWGNSLRSTARLVGIEPATGLSLLSTAGGDRSVRLRSRIRGVDVRHLELPEIWTFMRTEQKRGPEEDPDGVGGALLHRHRALHAPDPRLAPRQVGSQARLQVHLEGAVDRLRLAVPDQHGRVRALRVRHQDRPL